MGVLTCPYVRPLASLCRELSLVRLFFTVSLMFGVEPATD
jgi:hypothetical protein